VFERAPDGAILVRLSPEERLLLIGLVEELRALLETSRSDPSLRRLFPPAHERDEDERAYRELAGAELLRGRREALDLLSATAERDRLSPEEADAWLRALNDLRLFLGTRLDVEEGTLLDQPQTPELAIYGYLSWLQEQLVAALSSDLE
jgi:hypothetical protein